MNYPDKFLLTGKNVFVVGGAGALNS